MVWDRVHHCREDMALGVSMAVKSIWQLFPHRHASQSQLGSETSHMNEFWFWLKDPNSMSTMEELQMSPNLSLGCTCKHTHTHVNPHVPHIHMETEKAITHWTLHPAVYFLTIPTFLSKLHVCSMRWLCPLGSQNWAFFLHSLTFLFVDAYLFSFFYFTLACSNFCTFFF